jgi:hypothetical protein
MPPAQRKRLRPLGKESFYCYAALDVWIYLPTRRRERRHERIYFRRLGHNYQRMSAPRRSRQTVGAPISEERQAELQGYLDHWAAETDHGER